LAGVLNWPLEMLTYKKLKVITNRPRLEDFPAPFLADLRAACDDDRLVCVAADSRPSLLRL